MGGRSPSSGCGKRGVIHSEGTIPMGGCSWTIHHYYRRRVPTWLDIHGRMRVVLEPDNGHPRLDRDVDDTEQLKRLLRLAAAGTREPTYRNVRVGTVTNDEPGSSKPFSRSA
jgi:hypothetical protein